MAQGTKKVDTSDYENLTKEVEQLSLENDELLGSPWKLNYFFAKLLKIQF